LGNDLWQLCARYGIATDYHDIWGTRHAVDPAHLKTLLREFDVDLDAGADTTPPWQEALTPVRVLQPGRAEFELSVWVPHDLADLAWHIETEDGQSHSGTAHAAHLPETERAEIGGDARIKRQLHIALALPHGYHRLRIDGIDGQTLLLSAPERCFSPNALAHDGRLWGLTLQLHSLRSHRNWGIGDFTDLAHFAARAAREGAGFVGLNPLHALFPHNPGHCSPYSPSSRAQLNVLYLDVEAIHGFRDCPAAQQRVRAPSFQARLAALREAPLVEHAGVAAAKFEILELLYRDVRDSAPTANALAAFRQARGPALEQHATYEALQEHLHRADPAVWGWPVWPEEFRDADGAAVAAFAAEHADRVGFYAYLQWQASLQLDAVARQCRALGMPIGLYQDLAVSVDRAGSDAWRHRHSFALGASVGAPPDEFNPNGQNWGLPPLRPDRLRATGYTAFVEVLRASMRGAGAIRIDHVMGLMRLFWIPEGGSAQGGAYVHYPIDEMLAIVALESERNRCLVIGEDLGTVADEMRAALARFGVLSYRLMYFEHEGGGFRPPQHYSRDALVAVSTHDLATLAGWWAVHDLRIRHALHLFPNDGVYEKQLLDRAQERVHLLSAVQHATDLPGDVLADAVGANTLPMQAVEAVHAFLAMTPSKLMVVQLEDALGEVEQANMPGTTDQHPNWRRKYARDLEVLWDTGGLLGLCRAMSRLRPRSTAQVEAGTPRDQTLIPRATYRLQFHKGFTFDDAIRVLPYLARLGISHVYCSPIQRARPGSMHGYDVVAHDEINPELGGMPAFERFTQALRTHGMGQLLDLVPNHMGVLGADNPWWMDVLENGAQSLFAQHFDIEWQPLNAGLVGKVLVPVLGDHYGDVLDRGELQLTWDASRGELAVHYHAHRFPLAPQTYATVLAGAEPRLADADLAASIGSIATAFGHLQRDATSAQAVAERARDKELLKTRLARRALKYPLVDDAIGAAVAAFNAPEARDGLHDLLEAQSWRLAHWRVAADEINYRRFFDINELAALRIEREEVFEATHALALDLAARGWVDGFRIDHPDGLFDPAQYFERLQQGFALRTGLAPPAPAGDGRPARPLYVVAEKIAAPGEDVPESWAVHGTTGYRFANVANGVLVDHRSDDRMRRIWRTFTGDPTAFEDVVYFGKRAVARGALASELTVLSTELLRIARGNRRTRDYTLNTLRLVLSEVVACLAVYRTYIIETPSPQDERYIDLAIATARRRSKAADPSVFDFVREALLGRTLAGAAADAPARALRFATRFQQFSSPVAAKGVEDTAFYRYFPLSSLNEVGGDPDIFGMTLAQFHEASADRAMRWPHTMLATSTHDNKRSEDVRMRIDVLSEMSARWRLALRRWHAMDIAAPEAPPSAAHEYLFYQTVLGTLPRGDAPTDAGAGYVDRIAAYMQKAAREGKRNTSWTAPDEAYEATLDRFVRRALTPAPGNAFLPDIQPLADLVRWYGALNSLSLVLLKYTSPGVPDLYQGNELMDDSLVDPDNRRPVDYALRAGVLEDLEEVAAGDAPTQARTLRGWAGAPDAGRAKLWLTWRLLSLRSEVPQLFQHGDYTALEVRGRHARHAIAYARRHEGHAIVVLVVRLFCTLDGGSAAQLPVDLPLGDAAWHDTNVVLPDGLAQLDFDDRLTGVARRAHDGRLALAQCFADFPGAVLVARQ